MPCAYDIISLCSCGTLVSVRRSFLVADCSACSMPYYITWLARTMLLRRRAVAFQIESEFLISRLKPKYARHFHPRFSTQFRHILLCSRYDIYSHLAKLTPSHDHVSVHTHIDQLIEKVVLVSVKSVEYRDICSSDGL